MTKRPRLDASGVFPGNDDSAHLTGKNIAEQAEVSRFPDEREDGTPESGFVTGESAPAPAPTAGWDD